MHPVFVQAFYYGVVMLLMAFFVGLIQKGFFWKYLRVRMSFGRFILVKIRAINRDYFAVGKIDESFLVFKREGEEKRIKIKDSSPFYKAMAVSWIDIDDVKNAVCSADYQAIDGFDAAKYQELYNRALYKPAIAQNMKEKFLILLLIGIGIGVLVCAYLCFINYDQIRAIIMYLANNGGGAIIPNKV